MIKNDNFITIYGWMVKDLGLKGNELIIYARIYAFCQEEGGAFTGSLGYLAEWVNGTRAGVLKCLKSLTEKGFLEKKDKIVNGVKFCEYRITEFNGVLNKVERGCITEFNGVLNKVERGCITEFNGGVKQSLHKNTAKNTDKNTEEITGYTHARAAPQKSTNVFLELLKEEGGC